MQCLIASSIMMTETTTTSSACILDYTIIQWEKLNSYLHNIYESEMICKWINIANSYYVNIINGASPNGAIILIYLFYITYLVKKKNLPDFPTFELPNTTTLIRFMFVILTLKVFVVVKKKDSQEISLRKHCCFLFLF